MSNIALAYEDWQNFCSRSDRKVKEWNDLPDEEKEKCPLCSSKAEAYWNYDGNYDPHFSIECTNCSCKVETESFENTVKEWNTRPNKKD